jgi:hypothetical protein
MSDTTERALIDTARRHLREGRAALLLAYDAAGQACHTFCVLRERRGVARATATAELRVVLAADADTVREGDPDFLIRVHQTLAILSALAPEANWRDALTAAKAEQLGKLLLRPDGTNDWSLARDDAGGARDTFVWACGPDAPSATDISLRVDYYLDPAKAQAKEFRRRRKACQTAADYDALADWARSLDGRDDLCEAARAARHHAFPGGAAPGEDRDQSDQPGSDQRGADRDHTDAGTPPDPERAYGAQDAAELCRDVLLKSDAPDDALEALLSAVAHNLDFCLRTRLAAAAAAKVIAGRGTPSPAEVANALGGAPADGHAATA